MKRFASGFTMLALMASVTVARADIIIGVNLATTGPAAALGIPEKNTIALGPTVIAGHKIRYIIYDDASDTTTAVQNVKRLISEDKVDILIGPSTTPTCLAVVNTVADSKTPMLQMAPGPVAIPANDPKRRWIFNTPPNNAVYNQMLVTHMLKKGIKTVAVIAVDDPYGEDSYQTYKKIADPKGIKTLSVEKYQRTATSVTAQVLHAMQGKPDAIFIIASGTPAALPHLALIDRGYKGTIYQTAAAANPNFLMVGGTAVNGAYIPAPPVVAVDQLPEGYPTRKEGINYKNAYIPKFGTLSFAGSTTWDALKMIELAVPKALKSAKPGTEKFREALRSAIEGIKGFKGANAVYTLSPTDHSGVNELGVTMIRIENRAWKLEDVMPYK